MSAAPHELSVDSVTGIPLALRIAGPGARAYAFLIDWHIRLILGLAWFCAATLLYNGRLSLATAGFGETRWLVGVLAPALTIFLLYHLVLELALRGRTPGKRMAGVRIVDRQGAVPQIGALLVRNVFRLIDCLPAFYGVGVVTVVVSAEHVRVGDMAAGTLLVYESAPALAPSEWHGGSARVRAEDAELAAELLERWPALTPRARVSLAQALLARSGMTSDSGPEPDGSALRQQLRRLAGSSAQTP
jgi:uncharacterized RDD family membrane protein YckC